MKRTVLGIVTAATLALGTLTPASAAYYRHGSVHRHHYAYQYRPYYGYGYSYSPCNYYYTGCYYNYGYDYGSNWPFFGIFGSHHH